MTRPVWTFCSVGIVAALLVAAAWPADVVLDVEDVPEPWRGHAYALPWWSPPAQEAPSGSASQEVLYFYYGWYSAGRDGRNWRYGITDEPQAGYYDSHDVDAARHQLAMIRDTGGAGIIHSWWGAHSHDEASLRTAVAAAEKENVVITASFETWAYEFRNASPGDLAGQLTHVWHHHARSPAWLTVDGKPVIFVHAGGLRDAAFWEETFDRLRDQGIAFHAYAEVRDASQMGVLSAFDGAYYYMPVELQRDRSYVNANLEMAQIAREHEREWLPTVAPGYDNSNDMIKRHHLVVDDEGGALLREAWENATRIDSRFLLVGTWNEWNEGTAIEPGVKDEGRRLALVEDLIRASRKK